MQRGQSIFWLNVRAKCKEKRVFHNKHDLFNLHHSITELTGRQNKRLSGKLKNSNGEKPNAEEIYEESSAFFKRYGS